MRMASPEFPGDRGAMTSLSARALGVVVVITSITLTPPGQQGGGGFDQLLRGIRANDGNDARIEGALDDFGFGHGKERLF